MKELVWFNTGDDTTPFPDVADALRDPDGLLAVGGDLSLRRLLSAYRRGIFPWYSEGQPVLWWSPDPRTILDPRRLHLSRSLRKTLRSRQFETSMDRDFEGVIEGCSGPRPGQPGTWITREMKRAYGVLHRCGFAHSVEVWHQSTLVGGLYGVAIGGVFFGESMFNRKSNASKVALVALCERLCGWSFRAIDCQMYTEHLARMGAEQVPRQQFLDLLADGLRSPHHGGHWSLDGCTSGSIPCTD